MQHILRNTGKVFETKEFFAFIAMPIQARTKPNPRHCACFGMNCRSHNAIPGANCPPRGMTCHEKRWSRPVSRVLYVLRRDSHSSRPGVAAWLQQPTREQRGPRYRSPIWSCSEWGLPCRTTLAPYAVRSYRTLSPLPVPLRAIGGLLSVALAVSSRCPGVTWHSALRSPDFPRCACARRDCPADSLASVLAGNGEWGMGNRKAAAPASAFATPYSLFPDS